MARETGATTGVSESAWEDDEMRRVLQVAGILMLVAASCSRHSQDSLQRIDFRTGSGTVATGPLPIADRTPSANKDS